MTKTAQNAPQRYGQITTVDIARKQSYSTRPTAGAKRTATQETSASRIFRQPPSHERVDLGPPAWSLPPKQLKPSNIHRCVDDADQSTEWSQRRAAAATPGSSTNPLFSLEHARYDLDLNVVQNLRDLGVHSIYPWQAACLLGKGLLAGSQNLIYTAPTGGGKSLVADILLLKKITENPSRKALIVLPYVALVQEKLKWLRRVTENVILGEPLSANRELAHRGPTDFGSRLRPVRIAGLFGGNRSRASWNDFDVAICTIEKANSLLNTALEEGSIHQLGIVVIDELHMLDDEQRGYMMELMLTKLICQRCDAQIVGMSATLSNPEVLAKWLNAKYYVSKYRPVPIEEYLVHDGKIYASSNAKEFFRTASQLTAPSVVDESGRVSRVVAESVYRELENPLINSVLSLAVETATAGYGALVFCASRQKTQDMACLISQAMPSERVPAEIIDHRMNLLASLEALPDGFDIALIKTVPYGVAFHHAGLTVEERDMVAEAFDQGTLKVLVATASLAAGINLPARRVILHGARMGRELVGPAMLRQMRGRAGRKGKDQIGETYLCCQKSDLEDVAALLEADVPAVESCLTPEKRGFKRALLESIATRLVSSDEAVKEYTRCSLLWHTTEHSAVLAMTETSVRELLQSKLIERTGCNTLEPTQLGSAIVASSLTPEDGLFVYDDMRRALENFVMDSEMHIFYLFTPISLGISEISWPIFREQLESLDEAGLRAMRCVGVQPAFVNNLVNSGARLKESTPEEAIRARIYRRAYAAFQLRDLCNEVDIGTISRRYSVPRGSVQTLAQSCHGFAGGIIKFSERMGWGMLGAILEHMVDRLKAGARADLLEMAQVTYVKSRMARIVWENGFKTIRSLAEADPKELIPVMLTARRRQQKQHPDAMEKLRMKLLEKAQIIVESASRIWERQQLAELDDL